MREVRHHGSEWCLPARGSSACKLNRLQVCVPLGKGANVLVGMRRRTRCARGIPVAAELPVRVRVRRAAWSPL